MLYPLPDDQRDDGPSTAQEVLRTVITAVAGALTEWLIETLKERARAKKENVTDGTDSSNL